MSKSIPKIAESEWRVMKLLWKKAPQSANEIIDALKDSVEWTPKTIKTLLNRLVNKGALGFDKEGRSYLYYPLISEVECKRQEARSFVNRVFDGGLRSMVATFLEDGNLSKEEIEELRKFLDQEG
jgi:BlaI family penicillinase repressor